MRSLRLTVGRAIWKNNHLCSVLPKKIFLTCVVKIKLIFLIKNINLKLVYLIYKLKLDKNNLIITI